MVSHAQRYYTQLGHSRGERKTKMKYTEIKTDREKETHQQKETDTKCERDNREEREREH